MKPRAFAALAVITLVAAGIAIATYASQNRWSQAKVSGAALLPGLAAQASRIGRVELQQGDKVLALARSNEGWTLADRGGYPVKPGAVRALLVKLAQAELVEGKTRNKERFSLLELEDPTGKDSKSRLLRLKDDQGAVIAETIVGKKRWDAFGGSKSGTYVRRPGDPQTWLSNGDLDVSVNVRDWVPAGVLDLPSTKIVKLTVEIPGEEPLVIARDAADTAKHTLQALPEGKKLKEGAGIDAIVRAVGNIELDDVRKATVAAPAANDVSVAKIEADGGLAITIRLRKEGDATWVSLEASGAEGDAKTTAEDIVKRTQGWEYKVPTYKAQAILKRRADLIEAS
ncbi:MAG: DUF4340 domain-containing protein [Hyphomicrobiaceae bacterium]|nr:DUF4340 domain-containing protein [Hyphomicrobiaceae bacterium]